MKIRLALSLLLLGCDPGLVEEDAPRADAPFDASGSPLDAPSLLDAPLDAAATERCGGASPPSLSGVTLTRVEGVPIRDGFASGWGIVEGPVWVGDALYVSHFGAGPTPDARIYRVTASGVSVARDDAGTNGLALAPDGRIYAGSHGLGAVVAFDPSTFAEPTVIVGTYEGARFDGPNDLVVRSDGTVYFTDPDYQAPSSRPQSATRVYRFTPGGAVEVITDELGQPNGIALSLDERSLFVGHTGGLLRYPLDASGAIAGAPTSFGGISGSVDGLGRDCAGDLWVTNANAVVVLDPSGAELGRLPAMGATNVAFGGADGRTLYVTAGGDPPALYTARLDVAGLPD